ncbi:MAG TPA: diacylglycerol kinase family protein [Streptosporangiaceae bacterium]|nr:diacylglycerol kinase family protein [Streptosporangiaceae bacterium]
MGERLSALAAIFSVAAAMVLIALNIVLRFGAVLLALVGLLACVTACWYAVSRRGIIRVIALITAVLALAALVTGLVMAVISLWALAAVVGLAVVSVITARHALRRTPKALRSRERGAVRHPVRRSSTAGAPASGEQAGSPPPADQAEPGGADADAGDAAAAGAEAARAGAETTGAEGAGAGSAGDVTAARGPARPVLIMNLKSGGGKAERFRLADECRARGIEPIILRRGDDLVQLAEDAIADGAEVIGMAGGDGSQAAVASVAARRQIPHVCIPAGTRNHFALDLGLDRNDVIGALDAFADGVERRIDLAAVNGRTFVNNCSLGLYAKVVQSPEYRDAKLRTAADLLPDLLGPDAVPLDLRFDAPGGARFETAHLILVSNDPYQLAHPGGRGTRERLDTGLLGVVMVQVTDAADARSFMLLELAGQVRRFPGWQEWTAPRFEVSSDGPVEVGVDGEALVLEPPLVFESHPGALVVRLPKSALRLSPAARAVRVLTRSTAADLVSVAAGAGPGE